MITYELISVAINQLLKEEENMLTEDIKDYIDRQINQRILQKNRRYEIKDRRQNSRGKDRMKKQFLMDDRRKENLTLFNGDGSSAGYRHNLVIGSCSYQAVGLERRNIYLKHRRKS